MDTLSLKSKKTAGKSADEERAGVVSVRIAHFQMAHQDFAAIRDRKEDVLRVWSKLFEDHRSGIGHFWSFRVIFESFRVQMVIFRYAK